MLKRTAAPRAVPGPRAHPDVFAGVLILAFCLLAFWGTTTIGKVPAMLSQNVPPTFFPRVVLAAMAVLSLVLIGSGLTETKSAKSREKLRPSVFVTAGIFTIAVALVSRLGMLPTVFLVSIVLPLYWGERRLVPVTILAVGLPLVIHLLFTVALGMRFPAGALW